MTKDTIIQQIERIDNELNKEFSNYSKNDLEARREFLESKLEKQTI